MKQLVSMLCLILCFAAAAKRQRTGPTRLKAEVTTAVPAVYDTIFSPPDSVVRLSGYEKMNSSTRETFFATNLLPDSVDIHGMNITIDYFDSNERMLHSATHTIHATIPAGATRNLSIATWDVNHAFHYHLSTPPARRRSTPFYISISLNWIML